VIPLEVPESLDASWVATRLIRAGIPEGAPRSRSLAVDGTDVESWMRPANKPRESDVARPRPRSKSRGRAKGNRHTDSGSRSLRTRSREGLDARWGRRTATASRKAGYYYGQELHLAVQGRDVAWTNGVEGIRLGPSVPNVITAFKLVPASSPRDEAIVPELLSAKKDGVLIEDVIWDRGYSMLARETSYYPLHQAGIHQTFLLRQDQRGTRPFGGDAVLVDGALYSNFLPKDLGGKGEPSALPMPPMGATDDDKRPYEEKFNHRARYRYSRHAGPVEDGTTRWRCPFCTGFLRAREVPRTMRRPKTTRLVRLPAGVDRCCSGILSVTAAQLPLWQRIPFGTTAWRKSYSRRQAAESANAALKGGFVNMGRGFFRVAALAKLTLLMGFTLAGYNQNRTRSFHASRDEAPDGGPQRRSGTLHRKRRSRRVGTWLDILQSDPEERTKSPPSR
jgi:hypothetical protein